MSEQAIHYFNIILGLGAIAVQVVSVGALLMFFLGPKKNSFLDYLDKHFLPIGFLVSLSAWLVLIYSEIIHFVPCFLCWWQRIFMFPMAFLFGIALWKKDRGVVRYALPLLVVGFVISLYQNFFYYFGESSAPCDASGVSCYAHLVYEFGGYISIPMLALTGFFALLTLCGIAHLYRRRNS
jgi:disulfide bond formation protein DsbB